MNLFSSVRVRLAATVLVAVAPAWALLVWFNAPWLGFVLGLVALAAAWIGGELFVLRQVRALLGAVKGFAAGKLTSRTGLRHDQTELGGLARAFDGMADSLQQQIQERADIETSLLNRAHHQTVIAALGQFALVTSDLSALFSQAAMLVGQALDVEYCSVLELLPEHKRFLLRSGLGWKDGLAGALELDAAPSTQAGFTLQSGEPVVIADVREDARFTLPPLYSHHGVISSVTVSIQGHSRPFGVLGVHTAQQRVFPEEEVHFLLAVATALAMAVDRQRTEPEIQKLAAFAKFNPNPVLEFSAEGRLTFFNNAAEAMANQLGVQHPEALLPPDTDKIVQSCLVTGRSKLQLETRPGNRLLAWSFYPITASAVVHCYVEDTTERTSLEEQLRQAQKMESVGQLAAGVAHDFNNILTIIQGHSGLLMSRSNLTPAMTTSIQAVSFAAERAASLTRQLLMFSRKQVIEPKLISLKEVVTNLSKMLQRLLGETVTLTCKSASQLPSIYGDTGMMEQILMNLAVNARDAMPAGGELIVRTDPVQIDEAYVQHHPNAQAGLFVCLKVTDTGTGMDAATIKRIFEPFFTTKEAGKGTGLGLATVYGIVKQHGGWIEVESEVGRGTTFKCFLPATNKVESDYPSETTILVNKVRGGHETILVVEDEPVLRDLAILILQDCGYQVRDAGSGVEALTVWQQYNGNIDLLLTDMIMPDGLSGKDLAESLVANKPDLKVIFTSGYNVEDIHADMASRNGSRFLQKPYSRSTLAQAVRECLDATVNNP